MFLLHPFFFLKKLCNVMVGASLVAQPIKNLPAMQVTQVQSLSQVDPLEKGMSTHSNILAWRFPWIGAIIYGVTKSQTSWLGGTN